MKRVVVISTSLRRGSNSDMLAEKFAEGAKAAGNDVEKISLVGKDIRPKLFNGLNKNRKLFVSSLNNMYLCP